MTLHCCCLQAANGPKRCARAERPQCVQKVLHFINCEVGISGRHCPDGILIDAFSQVRLGGLQGDPCTAGSNKYCLGDIAGQCNILKADGSALYSVVSLKR